MCNCLTIQVPNTDIVLHPGDNVMLGRFDTKIWMLNHGWYSWGGNRPMCGWYLIDTQDSTNIKPLLEPDLLDIHSVTYR